MEFQLSLMGPDGSVYSPFNTVEVDGDQYRFGGTKKVRG